MANHVYTDAEIQFLKDNSAGISRQELTDRFNTEFGLHQTKSQIQDWCSRHGIKGRSKRESSQKYKIGDELVLIGEVMVIQSTEPNVPILKRVEYKKRILWREAHGDIPKNHLLIFLDGNKMNCTLENLACVPLTWMRILNQNGWLNGDAEVTKTALKWCELHYAISVKSGNRYVKQNGQRYR